jgi:hypothetical protein
MRIACAIFLVLVLVGCAVKEPIVKYEMVEVKVPVVVRAVAPPELLARVNAERPVFISPQDPTASSALDPAGEALLKRLLITLTDKHKGWVAWASPVNN